MSNVTHQDETVTCAPRRRLPIILIYALLGPPVGAIVLLLSMFITSFAEAISREGLGVLSVENLPSFATIFGVAYIVIAFSYLFGFVQALLTGVILAEWRTRFGGAGYLAAFIAPLCVGLAAYAVLLPAAPGFGHGVPLLLGAIGIAASLILRFFFRSAFSVN